MDVQAAWDRLRAVGELVFKAQSRSPVKTGWTGAGLGTVMVEQVDAVTMTFHEIGSWTPEGSRPINFNNVFRWTLDRGQRALRLEHLRFGPDNPVYLFDLVPVADQLWKSVEPHVCRQDVYAAQLEFGRTAIHLNWTVTGPKKDEAISYTYR